jgi:hypothetical protein
MIWEKAQELYQMEQAKTMGADFKGITAERKERRGAISPSFNRYENEKKLFGYRWTGYFRPLASSSKTSSNICLSWKFHSPFF